MVVQEEEVCKKRPSLLLNSRMFFRVVCIAVEHTRIYFVRVSVKMWFIEGSLMAEFDNPERSDPT